jgi:hypothetical protein
MEPRGNFGLVNSALQKIPKSDHSAFLLMLSKATFLPENIHEEV